MISGENRGGRGGDEFISRSSSRRKSLGGNGGKRISVERDQGDAEKVWGSSERVRFWSRNATRRFSLWSSGFAHELLESSSAEVYFREALKM